MQLARIVNGTVSAIGDYRSMFPQTSFSESGPSPAFLAENGCLPVSQFRQHDKASQKLVPTQPYIEGDQVYTVRVEALTANDLAQAKAQKAAETRAQRDRLLTQSDWTQLADYPKTNQSAWKQYRQALRDLPQQAGFPDSVLWPTAPDSQTVPNNNGAI